MSCSCYIYHDTFTPALSAGDPCSWLSLYPGRQEAVASSQSHFHVAFLMPSFLSSGLRVNERLASSADPLAFEGAQQEVWQQLLVVVLPPARMGSPNLPPLPARQSPAEAAGRDWQLLASLSMAPLTANCLVRTGERVLVCCIYGGSWK